MTTTVSPFATGDWHEITLDPKDDTLPPAVFPRSAARDDIRRVILRDAQAGLLRRPDNMLLLVSNDTDDSFTAGLYLPDGTPFVTRTVHDGEYLNDYRRMLARYLLVDDLDKIRTREDIRTLEQVERHRRLRRHRERTPEVRAVKKERDHATLQRTVAENLDYWKDRYHARKANRLAREGDRPAAIPPRLDGDDTWDGRRAYSHEKHARERERMQRDPEYREHMKAMRRGKYQRRKARLAAA